MSQVISQSTISWNSSMSLSVCPIAIVEAPVEEVWAFLAEPANYALWWEAQTRSITPEGHARAGQKIFAQLSGLGMHWDMQVIVQGVDESGHLLHLKTMLPFGITVYNHITCTALPNSTTQVSFG